MPVPKDPKIFKLLVEQHFKKEPWEQEIQTATSHLKAISDYSGVPLNQVLDLPYTLFKVYLRDSWVENMLSNEEGRKFLETCWRIGQTHADEQAIKEYQQLKGGV